MLAAAYSYGQKMALVNNTFCNVRFSLGGSIDDVCGTPVYVYGEVPARTTIRWPDPAAVNWNKHATQIYWRNFSPDGGNMVTVGRCSGDVLSSPVVYIEACGGDLVYSWHEDAGTGDVEIIIEPASAQLPATATVKRYKQHGNVAIIVLPMLEAMADNGVLHTRTNQSFITDAAMISMHGAKNIAMMPSGRANEMCRYMPTATGGQQVTFNCECGIEQFFKLNGAAMGELVRFSITQP